MDSQKAKMGTSCILEEQLQNTTIPRNQRQQLGGPMLGTKQKVEKGS